jgi:hypothetical protein
MAEAPPTLIVPPVEVPPLVADAPPDPLAGFLASEQAYTTTVITAVALIREYEDTKQRIDLEHLRCADKFMIVFSLLPNVLPA